MYVNIKGPLQTVIQFKSQLRKFHIDIIITLKNYTKIKHNINQLILNNKI